MMLPTANFKESIIKAIKCINQEIIVIKAKLKIIVLNYHQYQGLATTTYNSIIRKKAGICLTKANN